MSRSPSLGTGVWATVGAVCAICATVILPASAMLTSQTQPEVHSCALSSPCLEWDNSHGGAGMKGTSAKGNGVVGVTKRSTGSNAGVFGQDTSSFAGNSGVHGDSGVGYGVLGTSAGSTGVYGTSPFTAVSAISTGRNGPTAVGLDAESAFGTGVYSNADTAVNAIGYAEGVVAKSTSASGDAFLATAGTYAYRANYSGFDAFSVDHAGNVRSAGSGVFQTGLYVANTGYVVESQAAVQNDYTFIGYDDFGNPRFFTDAFGNVYGHSFNSFSAPTVGQKTSTGSSVTTYAHQSSSPTIEDFGEAQLVSGYAGVSLERTFASAIDGKAGYMVFVTPNGDCRGLYVSHRTPTGFEVRELQGGRSSIAFSYRIVAKPFGSTEARLPNASHIDMPRHRAPFERRIRPKV